MKPHDRYRIAELRDRVRPLGLRYLPTVGSTHALAEAALRSGRLRPPVVVLASRQTAGRGRGAATWWSGAGCITMTLALAPLRRLPPAELSIRAAVSIVGAIGIDAVQIKWPNDLVARGPDGAWCKLGGILCHRLAEADLVGIGLNVNVAPSRFPAPLRGRATSLRGVCGRWMDLTLLAAAIASHVADALDFRQMLPFDAILARYRAGDALYGRSIRVEVGDGGILRGQARGIDPRGCLILKSNKRLRAIPSGHIRSW
jgi:BirA family biotin operon repressor/biotin-[acetyl-CoA-carboxylase] ligase